MPIERFFINDLDLHLHKEVSLEGQEFHHLAHVFRAKVGDEIELVNGKGALAHAELIQISKQKALLEISSLSQEEKSSHELILYQAIPRLNRLDTILEKATELGVTQICLFPAERSERHTLNENQMERMRSVTIAALKQCGRLYLPSLSLIYPIKEWETAKDTHFLFGDLSPSAPKLSSVLNAQSQQNYAFITGPEGGFTKDEEESLRAKGAQGVKLHAHILRTDTASIVALGIISHSFI